jgi:hypothetical protein
MTVRAGQWQPTGGVVGLRHTHLSPPTEDVPRAAVCVFPPLPPRAIEMPAKCQWRHVARGGMHAIAAGHLRARRSVDNYPTTCGRCPRMCYRTSAVTGPIVQASRENSLPRGIWCATWPQVVVIGLRRPLPPGNHRRNRSKARTGRSQPTTSPAGGVVLRASLHVRSSGSLRVLKPQGWKSHPSA